MKKTKTQVRAEKDIDSARRKKATALDLSDRGLTQVPPEVFTLTHLEELDLSRNALEVLDESISKLKRLTTLWLGDNRLEQLPSSIGSLRKLQDFSAWSNCLTHLPDSIGHLKHLKELSLWDNPLTEIPDTIGGLTSLKTLDISDNKVKRLPETIGRLKQLNTLLLSQNLLTSLPASIGRLTKLEQLTLDGNPLNGELRALYHEGTDALMAYLRVRSRAQVTLKEAKLILVGEGEVGKSCLLGALRGDAWEDNRPTTHGIEIKQLLLPDSLSDSSITLNCWDFGGQRVYRPTHQLFFTAPAVYLVVWKPRQGSQQNFVKEWIKLITHRERTAKVIVVATHGGPTDRQPDIDRQELWDLFGKDTVVGFVHVDSRPASVNGQTGEREGECVGIKELKQIIADVALQLPELTRTVPKSWKEARASLKALNVPFLPLDSVLEVCQRHEMDDNDAQLFVTISHRLGHLIHYGHDRALRDIVILKPDWLAAAFSLVLDDKQTRHNRGLVSRARLSYLWNDPGREDHLQYEVCHHPLFLRLMERYDLSYRVVGLPAKEEDETSLIAQLVPDVRPKRDIEREWPSDPPTGHVEQTQICRVVDGKGRPALAEGLLYQLIVRLHKYSLGREEFHKSVHWQRGIVLDGEYNGRALLEQVDNDIKITVRAVYPSAFLGALTSEVKYLIESFWDGLRCKVMVPCIEPCGSGQPGIGEFEVEKLIESKRNNRREFPCSLCSSWQRIDGLLVNSVDVSNPLETLLASGIKDLSASVEGVREAIRVHDKKELNRFRALNRGQQKLVSKTDQAFGQLMQAVVDQAKDGPKLFSCEPISTFSFSPSGWVRKRFRLMLWCEHSRLPLSVLPKVSNSHGQYEIDIAREWLADAAPYLKGIATVLSVMLPISVSAAKVAVDEVTYAGFVKQLELAKECASAMLEQSANALDARSDTAKEQMKGPPPKKGGGADLRVLHTWLKAKDPTYGGLVRVQNKRQEFMWVHPDFESEY